MEIAGSSLLEFKIVQEEDLSIRTLVVQKDEPDPEHVRRRLQAYFDQLVGKRGTAVVTRVPEIPMSRGEKLQVTVSHAVHGSGGLEDPETVAEAVREALTRS
jgi:hypothetical protein